MIFNNKPPKLLDCRAQGAQSGAELFLVEGDSAANAVANLRNAQFQAVLPMQGKPMNAYKYSQKKVQQNPLFNALYQCLASPQNIPAKAGYSYAKASIGAGCDASFNITPFNIKQCRYQRIVLLMDADADGIHCGALMLLFFHRYMPALLVEGRVEMARAPVGEVTNNITKTTQYAYTDAQFMALLKAESLQANQSPQSLKYRGLAGIAANTLAKLCIDPQTRKTSVMGMQDAVMALEIFGGIE